MAIGAGAEHVIAWLQPDVESFTIFQQSNGMAVDKEAEVARRPL